MDSDLDLAQLQAEALYVHDPHGRLLRVNETDPQDPVPRFLLIRTRHGNLWRTRHDLPPDLAAVLEELAAAEPVGVDLATPPVHLAAYTELLGRHAAPGAPYAGPAYYLPDLAASTIATVTTITPANAELLRAHYPITLSELAERAPVVVCVADGVAVAACSCARMTAQVAEAGIHTVEAYRGRGYAVATARGWAASVYAQGKLPLYSTSWANTASQAVAARLGAMRYAVDFSLT